MFPIEQWSKEHLYATMQELLYSFNLTWFLMEDWMKKNCSPEQAKEGLLYLSSQFGVCEAKRIARILPAGLDGIEKLIAFLEHSHWCAFEEIVIDRISEKSFSMATKNCSSQRAAQKWGLPYYDCAEGALKLRTSFFTQVHPQAKVTRLFTPPATPVEGFDSAVSCAWLISLD